MKERKVPISQKQYEQLSLRQVAPQSFCKPNEKAKGLYAVWQETALTHELVNDAAYFVVCERKRKKSRTPKK